MLGYKQAKKNALDYLNKSFKAYKISLYEPGIHFEYGWIFYYDQEGVFHGKLPEINAKISRWLQQGKSEAEINDFLTKKERAISANSLGLVGQLPIFVDKNTAEVLFIKGSVAAIQQTVCRRKKDYDLTCSKRIGQEKS